jgi:hypothetical protein
MLERVSALNLRVPFFKRINSQAKELGIERPKMQNVQ